MKEEFARLRRTMITFAVIYLIIAVIIISGFSWTAVTLMQHFAIL